MLVILNAKASCPASCRLFLSHPSLILTLNSMTLLPLFNQSYFISIFIFSSKLVTIYSKNAAAKISGGW